MSDDILDQIDAALADASSCLCGCKATLKASSPSPWFASEDCQVRWNERQFRIKCGTEKAAAAIEAGVERLCICPLDPDDAGDPGDPLSTCPVHGWRVVPLAQRERVVSWVSFADVTAGPSAGGDPGTVDLRRRVQDGTAPASGVDRVHDAFRAEVIRQRLREYSVDGVRYVVGRHEPFLGAALDSAMESVTQDLAAALDELVERAEVDVEVHRYECPHSNCEWTKVALDHGVLLDLAEAHELESHVRLPWWKRWHR